MKKAFLLSISLHILLILGLGLQFSIPGCGSNKLGNSEHKEVNKLKEQGFEKPVSVEIISKNESTANNKKECKEWFGGIGLALNQFNIVVQAPEWYPAYKAGIRINDVMITSVDDTKGEPGTNVQVKIYRNNLYLTFEIKRDRICYESIKENDNEERN